MQGSKTIPSPLLRINFKMSISNFFSRFTWSKQESESVNISLPTEVWIHVWSFVDFDTRQEVCTLVSRGWLDEIRNSARLSGEMILRLEDRSAKDIDNVLSRWPKLKVLHLSDCKCGWKYPSWNKCNCGHGSRVSKVMSHWEKSKELPVTIETLGINLTKHALLRKIVVTNSMPLAELGDWGKASKVWFDPKIWTPANLKNVINLEIFVDHVPRNFEMVQIGQALMNVEHLYISEVPKEYVMAIDSELVLNLRKFILSWRKIIVKLSNLSVEAGVSKSKKKACDQGDYFTRRVHQTHIVSLLVIVGVTGEVDDHEGVGHEAHQAAQEHHGVAAVPQRELETQEPKHHRAEHLAH